MPDMLEMATRERPRAEPATVRLPARLRRDLARLALQEYPKEACGLLIGSSGDNGRSEVEVRRIAQALNLNQERAHDRYLLDPAEFVRSDQAARAEGLEIVGFWHSHPDAPARPSATDLRLAWNGYSYLIISAGASGTREFRSWRLAGGRFEEERLVDEEASS